VASELDRLQRHAHALQHHPRGMLLFKPVQPYVQLSSQEMANRLEVSWQQPTNDDLGFITTSGGVHTPNLATHYRSEWSNQKGFTNNTDYDVPMLVNDGDVVDCAAACSHTIGEEVQRVSVQSGDGEALNNVEVTKSTTEVAWLVTFEEGTKLPLFVAHESTVECSSSTVHPTVEYVDSASLESEYSFAIVSAASTSTNSYSIRGLGYLLRARGGPQRPRVQRAPRHCPRLPYGAHHPAHHP
jgi:hypothetical protein